MNAAKPSEKYSPFDVAVALSLYAYNVSPSLRAVDVFKHFGGDCTDLSDLEKIMANDRSGYIATELAPPSAVIYVTQALERYGDEAKERNRINLNPEGIFAWLTQPKN